MGRANRGIGLELVKQLLQSPSNTVIAGCRTPSKASELQEFAQQSTGRLHLVAIDVSNKDSIGAAAAEVAKIPAVAEKGIDYLVNNAGIVRILSTCSRRVFAEYTSQLYADTAFSVDAAILEQTFITNVVGPARVAQAFIGLVEKSTKKTIVNISSTLGSVGSDLGVQNASYSISKAALNMLVCVTLP